MAIVAGGRARRLRGLPKGLLRLGGRTILSRLLDLAPRFDEVLLVADDPMPYRALIEAVGGTGPVRPIADRVPGRGAPGGIHAALAAARTEWVVAVGCDMPFVTWPVVEALLRARSPATGAVCFRVGGRIEPLLAAYRASLAPRWERKLPEDPSLQDLLAFFHATVLPEQALREIDPRLMAVRSVNTPADAAELGIDLSSLEH